MDKNVSVLQVNNDSGVRYAGFWIRFFASAVDALFLGFVFLIAIFVIGFPMMNLGDDYPKLSLVLLIIFLILFWVVPFLYEPVMHSSKYQATIGMMVFKLKIVDLEHKKIPFWRALCRYLATILSSLTLCIGFIMIAFTKKKQGMHDLIASTLVVRE